MYNYFTRGTKTYFIYNDRHYYTDSALGKSWEYHKFEISAKEYAKAYRSK